MKEPARAFSFLRKRTRTALCVAQGSPGEPSFSLFTIKGILLPMHIRRLILSIIGILFGAFMFVYGGYDDSPGAQGLGALAFAAGIYGVIKSRRNR